MSKTTRKLLPIDTATLQKAAIVAAYRQISTTQTLLGYIDKGVAADVKKYNVKIDLDV